MDQLFPGAGTLINILGIVAGTAVGLAFKAGLSERVRNVVTDCLGLVTLLMAMMSAFVVSDPAFSAAVGQGVPMLIVLGSLIVGAGIGTALNLEARVEGLGGRMQQRIQRARPNSAATADDKHRFVQGWMTASLLFCVGPLTVLGSLNDGLGRGIDELLLKSVLDLFASMAFAASFGVGVLFSAASVLVVQGALTLMGLLLGNVMPEYAILAMTSVGGLILVGIALGLLRIRSLPVGDMLPAVAVAPLLAAAVAAIV